MLVKSIYQCKYNNIAVHEEAVHMVAMMANACIDRYAVYVLEASTSNRLTYFIPPLVRFPMFYSDPKATLLALDVRFWNSYHCPLCIAGYRVVLGFPKKA